MGYSVVFYSISYFSFFLLLLISKKKKGLRLFDEEGLVSNRRMLILLHIGGIVLFGAVPFLSDHASTVVLFKNAAVWEPFTSIIVLLVILLLFISPRLAEKKCRKFLDNAVHPGSPGKKYIITYFLARILFICFYESWFRGFLLNDCVVAFGMGWAIVLNICLYAILHIVNGKEEVIACFPFGLLLCSLCIWQGAVWPAIALHLALTVPYEMSFLKKINTRQVATI
jgi:membrane protease YdiL (CAAX protease family)